MNGQIQAIDGVHRKYRDIINLLNNGGYNIAGRLDSQVVLEERRSGEYIEWDNEVVGATR